MLNWKRWCISLEGPMACGEAISRAKAERRYSGLSTSPLPLEDGDGVRRRGSSYLLQSWVSIVHTLPSFAGRRHHRPPGRTRTGLALKPPNALSPGHSLESGRLVWTILLSRHLPIHGRIASFSSTPEQSAHGLGRKKGSERDVERRRKKMACQRPRELDNTRMRWHV